MKALTVQQPWAFAIAHAGKSPENRTWSTSYRGQLGIHAGGRYADEAAFERVEYLTGISIDSSAGRAAQVLSAFVAVVDLVDVHPARMLDDESGCCDPWGEQRAPGGKPIYHWVLADVEVLEHPVTASGRQQLWTPGDDILDQIREQVGSWDL